MDGFPHQQVGGGYPPPPPPHAELQALRQRLRAAEAERDELLQRATWGDGLRQQLDAALAQNKAAQEEMVRLKSEVTKYKAMAAEAIGQAEEHKATSKRLSNRLLNPDAALQPSGGILPAPPFGGGARPAAYNPDVVRREAVPVLHAVPLVPADPARDAAAGQAVAAVQSDSALQIGMRLNIPGLGNGTYQGYVRNLVGANSHTIDFDTSGPQTLDLRDPAWAQNAAWVVHQGVLYGGCKFRVENAGTAAVNGLFRVQALYAGEHDAQYCKVDNQAVTITKHVGQEWIIECHGGRYRKYDHSTRPPVGPWEVISGSGEAPAPRLVYLG